MGGFWAGSGPGKLEIGWVVYEKGLSQEIINKVICNCKIMRQVFVDPIQASSTKFDKFLAQYAKRRGYKTACAELPVDILSDLISSALMCFAAIDCKINETFELVFPNAAPLTCKKISKYNLEIDAQSMKQVFDIPDDDPMFNVLANPNNHRILKDDELFKHPLSEIINSINGEELDDPHLNIYALASFLINTLRCPEDTNDNGQQATSFFCKLILEADSTTPVQSLLERVKAGELSSMMKACTLIHEAFDKRIQS